MECRVVMFLELNNEQRFSSLKQMDDINKINSFNEADDVSGFINQIIEDKYTPDTDFHFLLFVDGTVKLLSKKELH